MTMRTYTKCLGDRDEGKECFPYPILPIEELIEFLGF